jgi:hypothetical protein
VRGEENERKFYSIFGKNNEKNRIEEREEEKKLVLLRMGARNPESHRRE